MVSDTCDHHASSLDPVSPPVVLQDRLETSSQVFLCFLWIILHALVIHVPLGLLYPGKNSVFFWGFHALVSYPHLLSWNHALVPWHPLACLHQGSIWKQCTMIPPNPPLSYMWKSCGPISYTTFIHTIFQTAQLVVLCWKFIKRSISVISFNHEGICHFDILLWKPDP